MKGLICGGIAPHGFSIVEEIAGPELQLFKPTRDALENLGKIIMKNKPDTIIILTPHGLRLEGYNAIYTSAYSRGKLSGFGKTINLDYKCDKSLAKKILKNAVEYNIPSVGCNFGAMEGPGSNVEMDWGTFIPLWFCKADDYKPEIVIIGPSRDISIDKLVILGEIIGQVCEESGKKVALIASCDHGHGHDPNGPFGFDEASIKYDEEILTIIKEGKLEKLLDLDMDLVERAKPDSLWQMLILCGALKVKAMTGTLISYHVPTYFGMAVVSYEP